MTQDGFPSLTGSWTGVYDYDDAGETPVAFTATLTDTGLTVVGEIAEPNTFSPAPVDCLLATVSGSLDGDRFVFAKRYEGLPAANHVVDYDGLVDARRTKIEGQWRVRGFFGPFSATGRFVMNRSTGAEAAEEERSTAEKTDATAAIAR